MGLSEEPEDVKPKLSLTINYEGTRASTVLGLDVSRFSLSFPTMYAKIYIYCTRRVE